MFPPPVFTPPPQSWVPLPGTVDTSHWRSPEDLTANIHTGSFRSSEAYRIELSEDRKQIEIGSSAAMPYVWQHLQQWQGSNPQQTPCGILEDAPRFPVRGFMLDISRCKVPTRESLARWVKWLAACRFNQFQLYTEHTFAYSRHEEVWKEASPITPEDIRWLQTLCSQHGIELVPNQNCFGHFERWIQHPSYRRFAETPDGFMTPWGEARPVGSVLKPEPDSLNLVTGLLDELLPLFQSGQVNIGCDETFELGQGASRDRCEREGHGSVYTDFVSRIMDHVQARHEKTPQFWADILLSHPEMLHRLPGKPVALNWGYEADHPFQEQGRQIAEAGLDVLVCPGTSSWSTFAGRTDNMRQNVEAALSAAETWNANGVLLTDWGDCGHLQLEEVSLPALAWCGVRAWNPEATWTNALELCDRLLLDGAAGDAACWAAAGQVSEQTGWEPVNCNALFRLFQNYPLQQEQIQKIRTPELEICREALDALPAPSGHSEAWEQTLRNLRLGLFRERDRRNGTREAVPLEEEAMQAHETLWRQRNREGGLAESLSMYTSTRNP